MKGGRVWIVLEMLHHWRPPSTRPFGLGSSAFSRFSAQRLSILWSIRCSRASAEVVGMPALCSCRISLLPSDLRAHVFDFRTDVIQSHGQLTVRCHENKVSTRAVPENLANFREAYPTRLARVSPPVGWHSL